MRASLANADERGHEWIQLKIARARSPKNWDRVRVIPGLYGVCRGELESPHPRGSGYGRYLIDVRTKDAHRVLARKAVGKHASTFRDATTAEPSSNPTTKGNE